MTGKTENPKYEYTVCPGFLRFTVLEWPFDESVITS